MKKTLILVAGPPATGKSYLIHECINTLPDFFLISPDEIKELFFEKYGFTHLGEKNSLETRVWRFYYHILEKYMWLGKKLIITEYPFSQKQKSRFAKFSFKYGYQILTIRLVCDFDVLWQRRRQRDVSSTRHLCHIMSHYQLGDILDDRSLADNHITKAAFAEKIAEREYNTFAMGTVFEVDVTDYSRINYASLLAEVMKVIEGESVESKPEKG